MQTLYRHLINIAVQNDNATMRHFNVAHLPAQLHGYYTVRHGAINNHVITVPVTETEAGLTQLMHHQSWHGALTAVVGLPPGRSFTNGAINDIVAVLTAVSNGIAASALGNRGALPAHAHPLALTLVTSTGAGVAGTDQQPNANDIQAALNALDGRGANRFMVRVTDDPATVGGVNGLPHGTDLVIQILDQLWNRRITIGARSAGTAHAHAEIISIDT